MPLIIPPPPPTPIPIPGEGEVVMSEWWTIALGAFAIISLILIGILMDDDLCRNYRDSRSKKAKKNKERRKRE